MASPLGVFLLLVFGAAVYVLLRDPYFDVPSTSCQHNSVLQHQFMTKTMSVCKPSIFAN